MICSLFHYPIREFLRVKADMFGSLKKIIIHRGYSRPSRLIAMTLIMTFLGCGHLPIKLGTASGEGPDGTESESLDQEIKSESKEIGAGEETSALGNLFETGENEEARSKNELDAALKRLVKDLEVSMQDAVEGITLNGDGTYLIRRGDYLDKIIKNTVGDYPFKRDILRKAFVLANPKVFRRSNPNWMYANKRMRIPQVEDIKKVIFKDQPRNKLSLKDDYADWVRYP